MRLMIGKSKINTTYHVIRDIKRDGKRSTEIVENLGNDKQICEKYNVSDAESWARAYIQKLNDEEKLKAHKILVPFNTDCVIRSDEQQCFNIGYLFLQQIYHKLGLPAICKNISQHHGFSYSLTDILSRLVYGRILFPSSKLSCYETSKELMEQADFGLHDMYRSLSVLAEEMDFIQAALYKNSKKLVERKTGILYYDCTNYYFEIEDESGLKQYGRSKENRPNPIVQMGLFMDRTGIPLAFNITAGNQNEQPTLIPLEEQIMRDFELSKFVVCTDAGLSSESNRKYNNFGERSFVTTLSIKKLPKEQQEWALSKKGWHLSGSDKLYDIDNLDDTAENRRKVFYKELYIDGYDDKRDIAFNQTYIVTFSLKYKLYQQRIREQQIERALKAVNSGKKIDRARQTDYKRFIERLEVDENGEIQDTKSRYGLNDEAVKKEKRYDGFYAVCTNLDGDAKEIIEVNQKRWEIEESFRIMKTEFEARPVYLQRDDRIKAHFMTCYIALLIYRILEKQLGDGYTTENIIQTLRKMNVTKIGGDGYIPSYMRTKLTDRLHEIAGFRTDYAYTTNRKMKGILRKSKNLK